MEGFFIFLFFLLLFYLAISKSEAIGNWSHLFPDMNHDPEAFYQTVKEILDEWKVPGIRIGERTFKQAGILSNQRLYLEITRGDYIYHICAAPFGTGFFFSWWLRRKINPFEKILPKIPVLGVVIQNANESDTYYKLDTDAMFRASVQGSVQRAIDQITKAKGIRALTELERKPDLRSMVQ